MELPAINASLNALALVLMLAAFVAVKSGRKELHKKLMTGAIVASAAFLACYLTYHFGFESRKYTGASPWFYYPMLISHIVLAALVPVGVVYVVVKAVRGDLAIHKKFARWTLPIWIYVSFTGILIYYMVHT